MVGEEAANIAYLLAHLFPLASSNFFVRCSSVLTLVIRWGNNNTSRSSAI